MGVPFVSKCGCPLCSVPIVPALCSEMWVSPLLLCWTSPLLDSEPRSEKALGVNLSRSRFTVDPTGGGRHRRDFTGAADGKRFFLRNCGFLNETGSARTDFTRSATGIDGPDVDLAALPSR